MSARRFEQVDVFTTTPYQGNPVAVVLDGENLDDEQMRRLARWTNLSETTFLLTPTDPAADYRVRIFTPALDGDNDGSVSAELPFAGHPTLGTCHAWLGAVDGADSSRTIVQECGIGLVRIRRSDVGLAFAAPPLVRSGPVEDALTERVAAQLGIERAAIVEIAWADNGPGWVAVLLSSAEEVLRLSPGRIELPIGAIGPYPSGEPAAFEVRAFVPAGGAIFEDPVTGSLNAAVAQWLLSTGHARAPYIAAQGTALGRAGRVHVEQDPDGTIWVGGGTITCIRGEVEL